MSTVWSFESFLCNASTRVKHGETATKTDKWHRSGETSLGLLHRAVTQHRWFASSVSTCFNMFQLDTSCQSTLSFIQLREHVET